jgi:hypothetical protein
LELQRGGSGAKEECVVVIRSVVSRRSKRLRLELHLLWLPRHVKTAFDTLLLANKESAFWANVPMKRRNKKYALNRKTFLDRTENGIWDGPLLPKIKLIFLFPPNFVPVGIGSNHAEKKEE